MLYVLTCLVSAVAKRDGVGRNPKKKVFAKEGLAVVSAEIGPGTSETPSPDHGLSPHLNDDNAAYETREREEGVHWGVIEGKEVARELESFVRFGRSDGWIFVAVPREATLEDVANVKRRMVLMKADLLAEVVTVRSFPNFTSVRSLFASRFLYSPFFFPIHLSHTDLVLPLPRFASCVPNSTKPSRYVFSFTLHSVP